MPKKLWNQATPKVNEFQRVDGSKAGPKHRWVLAEDSHTVFPPRLTAKSGGDTELKGFDASTRNVATAKGGTKTASVIRTPGKNVPKEKNWVDSSPMEMVPSTRSKAHGVDSTSY